MAVMKRVTLHISGNVQKAGFRAKAVSIANALNIKGNVQNLLDGRVKIVAEGDEVDLERFIHGINIKNTLIYVTDITKDYSNPIGDYDHFYKLVGEGETDGRLDTAADLLKELIHAVNNGFESMGGKIDGLGGKIDGLGGKIDGLGGKIDQLGDDLGGKIDQSRMEITSEIRSSRDDFRSHFDVRILMIEQDLTQIKTKLAI